MKLNKKQVKMELKIGIEVQLTRELLETLKGDPYNVNIPKGELFLVKSVISKDKVKVESKKYGTYTVKSIYLVPAKLNAKYLSNSNTMKTKKFICEKCNNEVTDSSKFCGNCGSELQLMDNSDFTVEVNPVNRKDKSITFADRLIKGTGDPGNVNIYKQQADYILDIIFPIISKDGTAKEKKLIFKNYEPVYISYSPTQGLKIESFKGDKLNNTYVILKGKDLLAFRKFLESNIDKVTAFTGYEN